MTGLASSGTQLGLGLSLAALALVGLAFYRRQNRRGGMGGAISRAKMLWLVWALWVWFIVCPLVAMDAGVARPLRLTLGAFAAFMWLRGLVELFMLYVTKNWIPPYGVAHNLASVALVVGCGWWWDVVSAAVDPWSRWALALTVVIAFSLVIETVYAVGFHRVVRGKTTGDEGLWFASADDPRFRRLVRLTAALNVPLYGFVAAFLVAAFAG